MRWPIFLALLGLCLAPTGAGAGAGATATPAGSLYFNEATDTIAIDGQTVLDTDATYEARIYFPTSAGAGGIVFNEWTLGAEDKQFAAGPGGFRGYGFPIGGGVPLQYVGDVSTETWHHVAWVHDSALGEQRLYLDGTLVATGALSGDIGDGSGVGHVGGIFRDVLFGSIRGMVDTLRISDSARYSGPSFDAPTGDLADDASALLLYNFNAPDFFLDQGAVRITDLSGNNRTGTLGAGFAGATSPAPPANLGDVDCSGAINAVDALKLLRFGAALSVSQTEPCPDIGEPLLPAEFGDVDCDGNVNSVDALKVLRFGAALSVSQTQPCPAFNVPT